MEEDDSTIDLSSKEVKQFPLTKKEFETLIKNLIPGTKQIKKEFLTIFPAKLSEVEPETESKTQIIFKNATVNENGRTGAGYFRSDGYCQKCGRRKMTDPITGEERLKCLVKYYFFIKEKPKNANFVLVNYRINGTHDHSKPITQIRGDARKQLREQILNNDNGSCKAAHLKLMGEAGPEDFVPSEVTLRKIKSEKNNISNWEYLLRTAWKSHNAALGDGKLQGFIESMRTCPQLEILYLLKEQIQAIQSINPQDRILFIDSIDKIVHIPKKFFTNEEVNFERILNYFCILKKINRTNDGDEYRKQVLVGELCTSQHDVINLTNFFNTLRISYLKYNETYELSFRLIVINFSWALIQSLISGIFCETITDYANRVYELAKGYKTISQFDQTKSWLFCCPSQTIVRFIYSLKKHVLAEKSIKLNLCLYFFLLIKSRSFDNMLNLYEAIILVCLSKTLNNNCVSSYEVLRKSIMDIGESEKKEIEIFLEQSELTQIVDKDKDIKNGELTELEKSFNTKALKYKIQEKSQFIPEFNKIIDNAELKLLLEDNATQNNQNYCPKFVEFINTKYMPFCFAWSSFTLIDLPYNRLTNTAIDGFNLFRNSSIEKNLLPHIYTNEILAMTRGRCKDFISTRVPNTPVKRQLEGYLDNPGGSIKIAKR